MRAHSPFNMVSSSKVVPVLHSVPRLDRDRLSEKKYEGEGLRALLGPCLCIQDHELRRAQRELTDGVKSALRNPIKPARRGQEALSVNSCGLV